MPSSEAIAAMAQIRQLMASIPPFGLETDFPQLRALQKAALPPLPHDVPMQSLDIDGLHAERLTPTHPGGDHTVLLVHGGGYVGNSAASVRGFAAQLASAAACQVVSVDYRLAPEHPYPAALEDVLTAYRWLLREGTSGQNIVLCGDSAGGGLSIATALALRDNGEELPGAVVGVSPWIDLALTGRSVQEKADIDVMLRQADLAYCAQVYAGSEVVTHPYISPLYADLHGFPPLVIHVGSDELLRDDSTRLAARAREAGVDVTLKVWDGLFHSFTFMAGMGIPEADQSLRDIADSIGRRWAAAAHS